MGFYCWVYCPFKCSCFCQYNFFFYVNVSHEQSLFPVEAQFQIIHHKHFLYLHTHALNRTGDNKTPWPHILDKSSFFD